MVMFFYISCQKYGELARQMNIDVLKTHETLHKKCGEYDKMQFELVI